MDRFAVLKSFDGPARFVRFVVVLEVLLWQAERFVWGGVGVDGDERAFRVVELLLELHHFVDGFQLDEKLREGAFV